MIYYESEYYGIQYMDDIIQHHGIKGQKWGVRRFQNEDGSLTPAGRDRYGVGDDYVVKSGAKTQRFTTNRDEEIGGERKYVSLTERDKQIYKDFYPSDLRKSSSLDDELGSIPLPNRVYEMTLSTIKDMKVAGGKTYHSAFMELYNDKSIRQREGWEKTEKGIIYRTLFKKKLSEINERELKNARDDFDLGLQERGRAVNQQFFDSLKRKGYDAVEDQFSKAYDKTDGNLIILDPKSSVMRARVSEVGFDKNGKYAGTISDKEGDKRYAAEKKRIEKVSRDVVHEVMNRPKNETGAEAEARVAKKYDIDIGAVDALVMDHIRKLKHSDDDDDFIMHHGNKWFECLDRGPVG